MDRHYRDVQVQDCGHPKVLENKYLDCRGIWKNLSSSRVDKNFGNRIWIRFSGVAGEVRNVPDIRFTLL